MERQCRTVIEVLDPGAKPLDLRLVPIFPQLVSLCLQTLFLHGSDWMVDFTCQLNQAMDPDAWSNTNWDVTVQGFLFFGFFLHENYT